MVFSPARQKSFYPKTLMQDSHPRPQLTRADWTDLCGTWDFAFDDEQVGLTEAWQSGATFDLTIEVPFPPESLSERHQRPGLSPGGLVPPEL